MTDKDFMADILKKMQEYGFKDNLTDEDWKRFVFLIQWEGLLPSGFKDLTLEERQKLKAQKHTDTINSPPEKN